MAHIRTNEQLVATRTRIGRYASLGGLVIIFGGLIASFNNELLLAYGALIVGFVLSNTGAYFLNRWALGAHEKLSAALKGTEKRYRLYNFLLPTPYLMLTPYGVTVFVVKNQDGAIWGDEKGWRQKGGIVRFFRAFSAEPLGDPPQELEAHKQKARDFIGGALGGYKPPLEGYIVFTNPRAQVTLSNVPEQVIVLSQNPDALKNALRRDKRAGQLSNADYDRLLALFEKEADARAAQSQNILSLFRRQ